MIHSKKEWKTTQKRVKQLKIEWKLLEKSGNSLKKEWNLLPLGNHSTCSIKSGIHSISSERMIFTRKSVSHFWLVTVVNVTLFSKKLPLFFEWFHPFLCGFTLFWMIFHSISSKSRFTLKRVFLFIHSFTFRE